jgi:carboxyl-terminal processing protease
MRRVVRPLAVFSVASALSAVVAVQLVLGGLDARGSDRGRDAEFTVFGGGYDLRSLKLVDATLFHVEEQYVEPGRIHWETMYVEALEAVERRVPVCMFTRKAGGDIVAVEVGEYRTVLEVEPITSRRQLAIELKTIAAILATHLDEADIPVRDEDAFASIEYTLINGMLSTLDPHSVLLPPEDAREMDVENQGEFGGLGITIAEKDRRLTIEYPFPDTPAMKAGLQADDVITRIEGESTINMTLDEAVKLLRGPVDAPIQIEIERETSEEPLDFTIVRKTIPLNKVEGILLEGGIAYIEIKSFHSHVGADLADLLSYLHRQADGQISGLVLDLRGNPGGYLTQAEAVSNTFLESGAIVSTVDRNGRKSDSTEAVKMNTEPRYPIAVLVNASSASASEIVAGALRNNERAIIVGERTFGKGSVQNLNRYFDDSKLKLTISKYLTPGDRSIQSVGIPADIELLPVIVDRADPDAERGRKEDLALVFWRERIRREADLDRHLEREAYQIEEPAYSLEYRRLGYQRRRTAVLEEWVPNDWEIGFARDVLLSAGKAWKRSEVLWAADRVVRAKRRESDAAIEAGFEELGVDWGDGPAFPRDQTADLVVELDLGPDGVLVAGQDEIAQVRLTNRTDRTLHRLAVVTYDNEILGDREFFFGKLAAGETASYPTRVRFDVGYPSENTPVRLEIRDRGEGTLLTRSVDVPVQAIAVPRLQWNWSMSEADGDGDGLAETGELVEIDVDIENVGDGTTVDPFVRLRNRSGVAIDIVRGNASPGEMVDAEGGPCEVLLAGDNGGHAVGDPSSPRVLAHKTPRYAKGCRRELSPGETWSGSFLVRIREPADGEDALELGLSLGDVGAYDYTSVVLAGFPGYFEQESTIRFSRTEPMGSQSVQTPPLVTITRRPESRSVGERATISGVVSDDVGIAHVLVFAGNDKVFFQGAGESEAVASVPFTADVLLQEGKNFISVLATDVDGYTHTSSVVTYVEHLGLAKGPDAD